MDSAIAEDCVVHAQIWAKDSDSIDNEERAMLADWLQRHVAQMALQQRSWDPLFAAVHNHGKGITLDWDPTEFGVSVTHSGTTSCAAALVMEHSAVVSGFVDRGRAEASQSHGVPLACRAEDDDDHNSPFLICSFRDTKSISIHNNNRGISIEAIRRNQARMTYASSCVHASYDLHWQF